MTRRPVRNIAASVRQRLYTLARQESVDFNSLLIRFALERLLFRLGQSAAASLFVVKGAMLFAAWGGVSHRSTRDLDLLGLGDVTPARLLEAFGRICDAPVPDDGLQFDQRTMAVEEIHAGQDRGGFRLTLSAHLGTARIPLQIDVGVGDEVIPQPEMITYPTLLDFPPPRVRAYTRESVIAEKVHAMVTLGIANSRMKDFFDLWVLCHAFPFEGEVLLRALGSTFEHRATSLPGELPLALGEGFAENGAKQAQWDGFCRKLGEPTPTLRFPEVVRTLREFLWPVLHAAARSEGFDARWSPRGGWDRPGSR